MSNHTAREIALFEKVLELVSERGLDSLITNQPTNVDIIMERREPLMGQIMTEMGVQPDANLEPDLDKAGRRTVMEEALRRMPLTPAEREAIELADVEHDIHQACEYAVETGRAIRMPDGGYVFKEVNLT